jgi:fucose permease
MAGTAGYILSSFFSGFLVRRFGVGGLLSLSCGATATTMLIYAVAPAWSVLVGFAFVGGLGAGAIDAGINTYVAQHYSGRIMQWLHASFGVGITLGPMIMTLGIYLTSRWQAGYYVVAAAQAGLALVFLYTKSWWRVEETLAAQDEPSYASLLETLCTGAALLSMVMFFIYTGVELGLGVWAYSFLTESRGMSGEVAGFVTAGYWAMFTVGRILAGWYSSRISVVRLLNQAVGLALFGLVLIIINQGVLVTVAGIGLTGFAIAPIFPGLVSDTETRTGRRHQANCIGMQIAAAGLGAALVPGTAGVLARFFGLEAIPVCLLCAFLLLWGCLAVSHRCAGYRLRDVG